MGWDQCFVVRLVGLRKGIRVVHHDTDPMEARALSTAQRISTAEESPGALGLSTVTSTMRPTPSSLNYTPTPCPAAVPPFPILACRGRVIMLSVKIGALPTGPASEIVQSV
jgi:hypothetical protein